jgi:hypothetical protein
MFTHVIEGSMQTIYPCKLGQVFLFLDGGFVVQAVHLPLLVGGVVTYESGEQRLVSAQSMHMHDASKLELPRQALLTYEGFDIGQ